MGLLAPAAFALETPRRAIPADEDGQVAESAPDVGASSIRLAETPPSVEAPPTRTITVEPSPPAEADHEPKRITDGTSLPPTGDTADDAAEPRPGDTAEPSEPRPDDAPALAEDDRTVPPPPPPPSRLDDALRGLDSTGTPAPPPREDEARRTGLDEPLPAAEKRPVPDYDGRRNPKTDAGDVLRWIPRVLLYPAYLVMEYGLRVPAVWTITRIEEYHITDRVSDFFTWDEGRASLFPLVSFDFGIRPNAGLVFRWDEIAPRHDVAATFFVGPDDLWAGGARVDQKLFRDEEALIRWSGGYVRRPDNVFYGVSDVTARCNHLERGCRYRSAIAEASVALVGWEKELSQFSLGVGFRHARFTTELSDSPPMTSEEAAALPGFANGYQILEPKFAFALDSRDEDLDFHTGTGLRFEGHTAFSFDVLDPGNRWWRAGGEAGAFYDLGFGQVLSTSLYYEGLLNVSETRGGAMLEVPFYELPFLGGNDQMKGFLRRRLQGTNAWAANFEYRYPITWGLDAAFFGSIGNTLDDLGSWHLAKNYLSYGLSLKLAQDRVTAFEAILGWGSNRLDEPSFDPFDQFRFSVGVNRGF